MKRALKNVSFVFLLLKMCFIFGQETVLQKRIVIDVGHGGKDSGAIGTNGIREKDIVLDIACAILNLNNDLDYPKDIYLTRYGDTLISLSDRTNLAKFLKADVFISLHCNHSNNTNARGIEVYVANRTSRNSDHSTWLAYQFQEELKKQLGFQSRGVKFSNFQVLRDLVNYCPSVLLELGFLSNWDESTYLSKTINTMAIAQAVIEVINQ